MNGISVPSERLVLSLAVQGASSKPAVSVRVGGTACEQTSWGSATSVGCVAAPGVSGGTSVVLTLPNRGVVTKVAGFHYETPRLEEVPHPRPLLFHVQSLDADIGNLNADVRRTRLKQSSLTQFIPLPGGSFGHADYSAGGQVGDTGTIPALI
eukprot:1692340-Rhodomonas_salina.1